MFVRIDNDNNNPLFLLYSKNNFNEFKKAIESGVNFNCINEEGTSLLQKIILNPSKISNEENKKFFDELLNAGVHLGQIDNHSRPLDCAIEGQNDIYYMKKLLEAGSLINDYGYQCDLNYYSKRNHVMFFAISTGRLDKIKLLLEYGADVNVLNLQNSTLLNHMLYFHKPQASKLLPCLLDAGINPNFKDKEGNTALHRLSSLSKHDDLEGIFYSLLKHGAKIDIKNKSGVSPFMQACRTQNIDYLKCLIKEKVNINERTKDGATMLMACAGNTQYKSLKFLIKNNADLYAYDNHNNNVANYILMPVNDGYKITKIQISFLKEFKSLLFTKNNSGISAMDTINTHFPKQYDDIYNYCFNDNSIK